MSVTIRRADQGEADLATVVAITNTTRPDWATSIAELRWSDATYPGTARFVAEDAGMAVGVATVGRIWVQAPDYDALWATVDVLEPARRRGTGANLLQAVGEAAATTGKAHLHVPATEDRPDSVRFLSHRGFAMFTRTRLLGLTVAGLPRPHVVPPTGIVLTTLADRPELVTGVHAVAIDAFRDIPGGDRPMAVGDLAEFRARDVDRPGTPPDAFMIAVDQPSDEVVGYASLIFSGESTTVALHDMTAVRRAFRRRGIATALKLATIAWAVDHGVGTLETGSDEANAAMRSVNRRLGYAPRPDELVMRGSVAGAMMAR